MKKCETNLLLLTGEKARFDRFDRFMLMLRDDIIYYYVFSKKKKNIPTSSDAKLDAEVLPKIETVPPGSTQDPKLSKDKNAIVSIQSTPQPRSPLRTRDDDEEDGQSDDESTHRPMSVHSGMNATFLKKPR